MHERQSSNPVYKKVLKNPDHFIVKHYAGDGPYNTHVVEHIFETNNHYPILASQVETPPHCTAQSLTTLRAFWRRTATL